MRLLERSCYVTHELKAEGGTTLLIREGVAAAEEPTFGTTAAEDTTGTSMWGAAIILARWLVEHRAELIGSSVIELGAGCGFTGLSAASLGAACVTLTDLNDAALINLHHNVESNRDSVVGTVRVCQLDWNDPASWPTERASFLLGADLLYDASAPRLLAALASRLLKPGGVFLHCGQLHGRIASSELSPAMAAVGLVEEAHCEASPDMLGPALADDDAAGEACVEHYRQLLTKDTFVLQRFRRASFLAAVQTRARDTPLPEPYPRLAAEKMGPLERALIAGNAKVTEVQPAALLEELDRGERLHYPIGPQSQFAYVPAVLSRAECARLRAFAEAAITQPDGKPWCTQGDSVDEALEWQLDLYDGRAQLVELLGERAVSRLWRLADEHHGRMRPVPLVASCAAPECWWVYIRRYTPRTRPWFYFHFDSAMLTVNIALADDACHEGGRLLAVVDGPQLRRLERAEGSAVVHGGFVPHAVTRMTGGIRWSLILFFGKHCPHPQPVASGGSELERPHRLLLCAPSTMRRLYARDGGQYHCDACGRGGGAMWHCAEGCEYDLCGRCRAVRYRVRAWREQRRQAQAAATRGRASSSAGVEECRQEA